MRQCAVFETQNKLPIFIVMEKSKYLNTVYLASVDLLSYSRYIQRKSSDNCQSCYAHRSSGCSVWFPQDESVIRAGSCLLLCFPRRLTHPSNLWEGGRDELCHCHNKGLLSTKVFLKGMRNVAWSFCPLLCLCPFIFLILHFVYQLLSPFLPLFILPCLLHFPDLHLYSIKHFIIYHNHNIYGLVSFLFTFNLFHCTKHF